MPSEIVMRLRKLFVIPTLIEEDAVKKRNPRGKFSKTRMDRPHALCYTRGKPIRKAKV
jgi:hypothetical protein